MTQPNIIFFYRTAHPFSNFHPSEFVVDGHRFHWAEQHIMYRKALAFKDAQSAQLILAARSPAECKQLGRRVKGFSEEAWLAVREQIAFDTVWHKFQRNPKLREFLMATGDALLVEAAPTDRVWGIGFSEQDAMSHRPQWGLNILGLALMQVREELGRADSQL